MQAINTQFVREGDLIGKGDAYEGIANFCLGFLRTAAGCKTVRVHINPDNSILFNEQEKSLDTLLLRVAALACAIITLPITCLGLLAIQFSASHQTLAKYYNNIRDPISLPPELLELILIEGGNFESARVSKTWNSAFLSDAVWKSFALKLGIFYNIRAKNGEMHSEFRQYCTEYMDMIHSMEEASFDLKRLLPGQFKLEKLLQLMEWKASRDKILIIHQLAELTELATNQLGERFSDPLHYSKLPREAMVIDGEVWSTWFNENRNRLNLPTELRLIEEQVTKLPAEIALLTGLEHLNIDSMGIALHLDVQITQLAGLRQLSLIRCNLKALPPEIGQLTNLENLWLKDNQLQKLPKTFCQLTSIKKLSLDENHFKEVPNEIFQLKNLMDLSLQENVIEILPEEFRQLTGLKHLSLSGNKVKQLLEHIFDLTNLESLSFCSNQIEKLPAEIGRLTNLKDLEVYDNKFEELPAEIGQLNRLTALSICKNQLETLPDEFSRLTNLALLIMQCNKFETKPGVIRRLPRVVEARF